MQRETKYSTLKQSHSTILPPIKWGKSSFFTSDTNLPYRTSHGHAHRPHAPKVLPEMLASPGQPRSDSRKTRGDHKKKYQDNTGKSSEHQGKKLKVRNEKNSSDRVKKQTTPEFLEYGHLTRTYPKWSSSKLPAINFSVYKLLKKKLFEERNGADLRFCQPVTVTENLQTLTGYLKEKSPSVKVRVVRKPDHLDIWRNPESLRNRELLGPIFTQPGQSGLSSSTRYHERRTSTPMPTLRHAHLESRSLLGTENYDDHDIDAPRHQHASLSRRRIRKRVKANLSKNLNQSRQPETLDGRLESYESRLSTPHTPASSVLSNFRYFSKMKSLVSNGTRDDVTKIASFLERTKLIEVQLRKKKLENLRKYFIQNEAHKGVLDENDDKICLRNSQTTRTDNVISVPKDKQSTAEISDRPLKFYQTFRKEKANGYFNQTKSKVPECEKRRMSTASSIQSEVPITGLCKIVFRVRNEKGVMVIAAEELNEAMTV